MMKTTTMLIIIVTVKSTAALPLTRPDDITWSTPCRHDVDADLRPLHCTDTTGNDVTVDTKATRTTKSGNVTGRRVWTNYPFPYDPWLGWYIAAIISGLILTLVFCEGMDRVKHAVVDYLDARQEKKRLQSPGERFRESTTSVVAERVSSRPDNDDTITTTSFTGVNATLRTDTDRQQRSGETTKHPTAARDHNPDSSVPGTRDNQDHDRAAELSASLTVNN